MEENLNLIELIETLKKINLVVFSKENQTSLK